VTLKVEEEKPVKPWRRKRQRRPNRKSSRKARRKWKAKKAPRKKPSPSAEKTERARRRK